MDVTPPASGLVTDPKPVLSVQGVAFDRADLVLVAFVDGSWQGFEHSIRLGLACERAVAESGRTDGQDRVRDAAVAFRRARGLVAGDQLRAWLAQRCLSMDDWTGHLRRCVSRDRPLDPVDSILARYPVPVDDVAAVVDVDMVCDGILQRSAHTLIGWAAAASRAAPASRRDEARIAALAASVRRSAAGPLLAGASVDLPARLGRLVDLESAYERFVSDVTTDVALGACLDEHRLGWLRFRCLELRFTDENVGREAVLCLREDGLKPEAVARLAGAGLRAVTIDLEHADRSLAPLLVAARRGDVVGPLPGDGGTSRLLVVSERIPPLPDDPGVLERARAEIVRAALEPLVAGTVRWHDAL